MNLPPEVVARLSKISVGLRRDLTVSRHEMRRDVTYVFHDPTSFQNHAFNLEEFRVMIGIVSHQTLGEVLAGLIERDILVASDRDEFYGFVLTLHGKGLLQLPIHDAAKLYERHERKRKARRKALLMAPMYLKLPLWDPDEFLGRTYRRVRWLFSRWGLLVAGVLWAIVGWNLLGHFDDLFGEAGGLLDPANFPLLYVALVGLKILHEFGHGYMCKKFGGEVPEMGVALIVGTPCAYVDASASWKFDNRWQRIAVSMAGMYVEAIIAALFALLWIGTVPGFVHDLALNVCVLSTVTTVLFNLNPLMRFDGYYVFADLVGTANLRERSVRFLGAWARQLFLRFGDGPRDVVAGEAWILGVYGVASAIYKVSLALGLTAMMLLHWPMVGLLLSIFFGVLMIVVPVLKLLAWLWSAGELQPVRRRARVLAVGLVTVAPLLLTVVPVSWSVVAEGLLDTEHRQILRAPADGFVTEVLVDNGDVVPPGRPVVRLANEAVDLELALAEERLNAEEVQYAAHRPLDSSRAAYHAAGIGYLRQSVESLRQQVAELGVTAPFGGTMVDEEPQRLLGRFVRRGDALLEVHGGRPRLRVLLSAVDAARAEIRPGSVATVVWRVAMGVARRATVTAVRPVACRDEIPLALTMAAGGEIYTIQDSSGTSSAPAPYVQVYLEPEWVPESCTSELTVRVRFSSDVCTVGQWLRKQALELYTAWRLS